MPSDKSPQIKQRDGICPLACPYGHRNIAVYATRIRCQTCRRNRDQHLYDREELVDLREEDPPMAGGGS